MIHFNNFETFSMMYKIDLSSFEVQEIKVSTDVLVELRKKVGRNFHCQIQGHTEAKVLYGVTVSIILNQ